MREEVMEKAIIVLVFGVSMHLLDAFESDKNSVDNKIEEDKEGSGHEPLVHHCSE